MIENPDIPELVFTEDSVTLDGRELTDVVFTIDDVMQAGHCVRGAKRWFGEYELDFRDFLAHGISAYDFLSTRDGHAIGIARNWMKRNG